MIVYFFSVSHSVPLYSIRCDIKFMNTKYKEEDWIELTKEATEVHYGNQSQRERARAYITNILEHEEYDYSIKICESDLNKHSTGENVMEVPIKEKQIHQKISEDSI